ncbi:MAG: hypothetical protein ACXVB1_11090 [Pseudobdellovibrionaceae bacterium]
MIKLIKKRIFLLGLIASIFYFLFPSLAFSMMELDVPANTVRQRILPIAREDNTSLDFSMMELDVPANTVRQRILPIAREDNFQKYFRRGIDISTIALSAASGAFGALTIVSPVCGWLSLGFGLGGAACRSIATVLAEQKERHYSQAKKMLTKVKKLARKTMLGTSATDDAQVRVKIYRHLDDIIDGNNHEVSPVIVPPANDNPERQRTLPFRRVDNAQKHFRRGLDDIAGLLSIFSGVFGITRITSGSPVFGWLSLGFGLGGAACKSIGTILAEQKEKHYSQAKDALARVKAWASSPAPGVAEEADDEHVCHNIYHYLDDIIND